MRLAGIEPVRVSPLDPKSSASASSAIGAALLFNNNYLLGASYFSIMNYMKKVVFVCHGNICRSVAAEYIMKSMTDKYIVVSRATSYEEIGNDIYPPMKRELTRNGIPFSRHYAQRIDYKDYDSADYIFYMDDENRWTLGRMFPNSNKIFPIYRYSKDITEIEDPWYTDRFDLVVSQIKQCVKDILANIDIDK